MTTIANRPDTVCRALLRVLHPSKGGRTNVANQAVTVTLSVADAARELANSMGRFYRYVPGEGWQNRIGGDWETCSDDDLDAYYQYEPSDDLLWEAAAAFSRLPAAKALAQAVLDAAAPLMTGGES